jgi:VanZ family protein
MQQSESYSVGKMSERPFCRTNQRAPCVNSQKILLLAICLCVLSSILVAGLWPFHAPKNEVRWITGGSGLFLGKNGSIVSMNPFKARGLQGANSCTLEIGLQPTHLDSEGVILSFYWPEQEVTSLVLRQLGEGLVLEHQSGSGMKLERYVGGVFRETNPILLTITSGDGGTSTYVEGMFIHKLQDLTISNRDITGQLLIGNAASRSGTWSGQVDKLSIYGGELSPAEVSRNFVQWRNGRKVEAASRGVVASYAFNEGVGRVIHNQVDSATDLIIPQHFFVIHKNFLERPWTEFHPPWSSYLTNVAINILGFIPLGFFFCAYFSQIQKVENAAAVTVAFGFVLSLIIEVLQAFLPTRASGMTDLVTNTLGTAVGVMAFRHKAIQTLLSRLMVCHENSFSADIG